MNDDGAFILAETRRKTSVLLFVDSIFINDSEEFRKMFVARIALAHAFKKTNTNVTEQLTSKFEFFSLKMATAPHVVSDSRTYMAAGVILG